MLILSPRAVERLETYQPPWPLPKIFRMTKGGKLNEAIFEGETINTPSMLCVEDYLDTLQWAKSIGGLPALIGRADANARVIAEWARGTAWVDFLAQNLRHLALNKCKVGVVEFRALHDNNVEILKRILHNLEARDRGDFFEHMREES